MGSCLLKSTAPAWKQPIRCGESAGQPVRGRGLTLSLSGQERHSARRGFTAERRRGKEKKQIKTRAEGAKVSGSSPVLGASAVTAGAEGVRLRKSQPEGEGGGPARSAALRAGTAEARGESGSGGRAPRGAPEATARAQRPLTLPAGPPPRGRARAAPEGRGRRANGPVCEKRASGARFRRAEEGPGEAGL